MFKKIIGFLIWYSFSFLILKSILKFDFAVRILFEHKTFIHAHMWLNDGAVACGALCLAVLGGHE